MKKQILIVRLCCLFALIAFVGSGAFAQSFTLSIGAQNPNPVKDGDSCKFTITGTRNSGVTNTVNVTFSQTSNTAGTTSSFTPNPLVLNNTNPSNSTVVTFYIPSGTASGTYQVNIRGTRNPNDIVNRTIDINVCNVIASNPQAQTACEGTSTSFSVTAVDPTDATYQWRRDGVNLVAGPSYSGVNASTLTINSVATGDAGDYDVIVGNSCGTDTSSAAALTVNTLPAVSCPATSLLFVPDPGQCGQNVSYSATATGSPTPSISYSPASGAFYNVGSYTATATATNICGSNTCTISFKVAEDVPPVVQKCVDPITSCNPQVFWTAPLFSDNCGIQTIVSTHSPNSTFPLGTTIVTYTAFDSSGNSVDCSFDVTITAPPQWYVDADGDGYGSSTSSQVSCTQPSGYADNAGDCDDSNAGINPAATEICDNIDNDCDGLADDADSNVSGQLTWYADSDGDTFGTSGTSVFACSQPNGYVSDNSDCDDTNSDINPDAQEICDNGVDNDCNGVADDDDTNVAGQVTWYSDSDGDTFGDSGNFLSACVQPNGYVLDDGDCNDSNAAINPDAQEICNTIDDDCDNNTDDNDASVVGQTTWYVDLDTDSYGDASASQVSCFQPTGYVSDNTDCDDGDASINPAATEVCNAEDDDCDGLTDNGLNFVNYYTDADGDTYGTGTAQSLCSNPGAGFSTQAGDCDDSNAAINPAATEICDGVDNDCDGALDSADPNFVDTTAPVAPSIADATGECSVSVTAPTATDNCAGSVTGTTSDPLSYSAQGTYTITWSFNDGNGNTSTATQTVIVDDATAPAAPSIADATGECSVTVTAPTATDNCAGSVTGTTSDPLSYSAQGTYTITWSFDDGNGNSSTATQTVIVDDVTAPAAPSIADATGECGVAVTAPTATDNCAGSVTGTTADPLSYSAQGTYTITWTFDDGNGNSSTATQNLIVDDVTAPVAPSIADATGECGVTVTAPTATDNCAGTVTGTTTDPLSYSAQGTYTITWTFDDGNGNSSTATQNVIVDDVTAPAAPSIADATGECSVSVTAPTATDNCAGSITGTTTDAISYSAQGTYTITWSFDDGNGNSSTATQNVIVDDVTAPVAPSIADATGECGVTVTAPTATDNCAGTVTGTTTDPLSYSAQGTYTITWTFDDGNGNSSTATQNVIVDDVTAPVAPSIADATGECSITVTAPTATDNCAGNVTGTTSDPLSYNAQGTYTITWTFDDGNGNSSTATQNVIVDDVTAPVVPTIANATGECSVTVTAPTTTDNCAGTITGSTRDPLTYTAQGTYIITWEFNDGNGNLSTATQTVIVDDVTAPVPPTIADATGECGVTVTAIPTANDNCSGTITGSTRDPLTYTAQGTFTITWEFNDGNGNTSTATQTVIVDDVTAPLAPSIANATGECTVTVTAPTATDNCVGSVTGATSSPLTYSTQGTYSITWTFDDGNGNSSTATQTVIVDDVTPPVAPSIADATGECSVTVTAPTAMDNCVGSVTGTTSDPLSYSAQGTYTITWSFNDGNGNSSTATQTVIVDDVTDPVAVCKNATIYLNAAGQANLSVANIDNGSNDNCGISSSSLSQSTYDCTNLGNNSVTLTITDIGGNTNSCTSIVTVLDTIRPSIVALNSITASYNPALCGATVTYGPVSYNDNCVASLTQIAGLTSGSVFPIGNTTNTFVATDASGNTATMSFTVVVNPSALTLTLSTDADSVQYSDRVVLTARIDGGASICGPNANDSASFFIGSHPLGNAAFVASGNDLIATLNVAMRGTGTSNSFFAPGNKSLNVTINNTPPVFNVNSSATAGIEITQENASAVYTGLNYYSTPSTTNLTTTVTLQATIYDITALPTNALTDPDQGDISRATVSFVDRSNGAILASNLPVTFVQAGNETIGYASYSFSVTLGTNEPSRTYDIGTVVSGYYTYDQGSDVTPVIIAKPLGLFISGGGFIYLSNPGGSQSADIGTKNNFAFSVKFNKRLTNLIGNVNFIIRKVESDGIEHTYQIKGNNLQSLAFAPDSSAQLTGRANVQDITNPDSVIGLFGNAIFSMKIKDNGDPGVNNDLFWMNLNYQGNLWYVSNALGTLQTIDGGNIKVSSSSTARVAGDNLEGGTVLGQNFPNPASDHTSITFSIPEDGEALLQVFGQRGELLQQIDGREYAGGMIHRVELDLQHLAPGNYFYRLITNDEVLTRTFTVIR